MHDEITLEMSQAEAQEAAPRLATLIQQARYTDLTRVPVKVEVMAA